MFAAAAPNLWNGSPRRRRSSPTAESFESLLKTYLLFGLPLRMKMFLSEFTINSTSILDVFLFTIILFYDIRLCLLHVLTLFILAAAHCVKTLSQLWLFFLPLDSAQ